MCDSLYHTIASIMKFSFLSLFSSKFYPVLFWVQGGCKGRGHMRMHGEKSGIEIHDVKSMKNQ